MVMPILVSAHSTVRHFYRVVYIGATAGTGFQITGSGIATAILATTAVLTLALLNRNSNQKKRNDDAAAIVAAAAAADLVNKRIDEAYEKGLRDRDAEYQRWLQWSGRVNSPHRGPVPPPAPLPPIPPAGDDDVDT